MHLSKTGAAEIVNKAVGERPKINPKMHQQSWNKIVIYQQKLCVCFIKLLFVHEKFTIS